MVQQTRRNGVCGAPLTSTGRPVASGCNISISIWGKGNPLLQQSRRSPHRSVKGKCKGKGAGPGGNEGRTLCCNFGAFWPTVGGASCKSVRAVEVESFGLRQWGVAHLQAVSHCQPNKLTRAICSSVDVP